MAVTFDTVAYGETGANSSFQAVPTIAAGHTNLVLVFLIVLDDTGSRTVSSISGAGVTWSPFATGAGNGRFRGAVWFAIGAISTGAQTLTVTMSGAVTNQTGGYVYSYYNVNQTTPLAGAVFTISGNNVITVASGDGAAMSQFDNNNNRTVTGCTTTLDDTGFSNIGHSATHCTASPTSTATWSGFDVNSLAIGVAVKQLGGGGTRGLFRAPSLGGVGIGGSFFGDPLQAREQMVKRNHIYVPERYAA